MASSQVPGLWLPVPKVCLLAIPQGAPQSERAALGEVGGEPGAGQGGGVPAIKSDCLPRRLGQRDSRAASLSSELGASACRETGALGSPGGLQPGRVGAQARGMLGSVKMEAHDLAEWSYYPEAGEVCPRGWRSGKWGAGVGLRA